jgi:redox-sensitive bicupin YhaK (pirin superfamily)
MYPSEKRTVVERPGSLGLCSIDSVQLGTSPGPERLVVFSEEVLEPGAQVKIDGLCHAEVILFPVAGGLEVLSGAVEKETSYVAVGEVLCLHSEPESEYLITNPYAENSVRFLYVAWRVEQGLNVSEALSHLSEIDVERTNELVPVLESPASKCRISFGRFTSGEEVICSILKENSSVFVFVLAGAIEIAGRLLYSGDSLGFRNGGAFGLEVLSDEAIFVIYEAF